MYQAGQHWDRIWQDKAGSAVHWVLCKKYGLPIGGKKKKAKKQQLPKKSAKNKSITIILTTLELKKTRSKS